MKGEASPYSFQFRLYLDSALRDIVSLLTYTRSSEELEHLTDLYNVVTMIRFNVKNSDTTLVNTIVESIGANSHVSLEG